MLRTPAWPLRLHIALTAHNLQPVPRVRLYASGRSAGGATDTDTDKDVAQHQQFHDARTWLAHLHADSIPKSIGELSFSRSSGPGGQNVNKVNSKATLKVPLHALLQHVPAALHRELTSSRYVTDRSNALIIQADDSRKQSDNAHSCYRRLHEAILDAGRRAIPGETSADQAKHVKHLQRSDNERRLKGKKLQSAKKSSRRGRGDD